MPEDRLEKTIDVRINNRKLTISLFLRTVFAAVLSFIIFISITMLTTGLTQKKLYEEEYYYDPDTSEYSLIATHPIEETTTAAGEMTATEAPGGAAATEAASQGGESTTAAGGGAATDASGETAPAGGTAETSGEQTTTSDTNIVRVPVYSTPSTTTFVLSEVISLILMTILYLSFPYSILWMQGDKDANYVQFGHMKQDTLRGLKIGAWALIPSAIPALYLILCKLSVIPEKFFFFYRVFSITLWPVADLATGSFANANKIANYSWGLVAALILLQGLLPLIAHVGYTLGYKHISLMEKFVYVNPKKKKKRRKW